MFIINDPFTKIKEEGYKHRMKGNSKERNGERLVLVVIFMLFLPLLFLNSSYNKLNQKPKSEEKIETSVPSSSSNISSTSTDDVKDPYKLSFSDHSYLTESELRNRLSTSELEYCSYVTENSINDLTLTWNLKSSGNEVYRCTYTYDKKRDYSKRSMAACSISKGYQEYLDGDKTLIRDYVMPEKDDQIEMFVYD